MSAVIRQQRRTQRSVGGDLQAIVNRGVHRHAAAVNLVPVAIVHIGTNHLGDIARIGADLGGM
jgi:hypothetical protein